MFWILLKVALVCLGLWLIKIASVVRQWWLHRRHLHALLAEPFPGHWLRGHVNDDITKMKETSVLKANVNHRVYRQGLGPVLTAVTPVHPETIADVMRAAPPKFAVLYKFLKLWLGNGLVTSEGKRWARDRQLLSHVFSAAMLKQYVSAYKRSATTMLDLWAEKASSGQSVDISEYIPLLTLDIILQCAFGQSVSCQGDKNSQAAKYGIALNKLVLVTLDRFRQPWYFSDYVFLLSPSGRRFTKLKDETGSFSESLIQNRRELLESRQPGKTAEEGKSMDMLDTLLTVCDEDGVGLSDRDIREHVDTFLFAGHDTTSAVLQWALYYLSQNIDVQEKCRAEAQQVMEECGGKDELGYDDLNKLEYLDQVVRETLRMGSVISTVSRCAKKPTTVDNVSYPQGTFFHIDITGLHYNEEVWKDPETFNPDRFSPEQGPHHPYAFLPFSCGPRGCLGKRFAVDEIKVVLCLTLMRFHLSLEPDAPRPHHKMYGIAAPCPAVKVVLEEV